jgi:beta-glucosidase
MPPARFSPHEGSRAIAGLLRSHCRAYQLIHEKVTHREGPWKDHPLMVGIAHNMLDFTPDRRWHPLENALVYMMNRFYNLSWLDAITGRKPSFGIPGLFPAPQEVGEALKRPTADFIGVNYYTKAYVQWRPRDASPMTSRELPFGIAFARRQEQASDLGWAIHPAGFGKVLRQAASYGLPIYVTENGIADASDQLRTEYLRLHLSELAAVRQSGVDIRGYYHWSLLDNFEWVKGFKPRFGLYRVDYETFERRANPSAEAYRKIITAWS